MNSLFNKPPEATSSPTSQIVTETPKPPTETSASPTPTLGIGSTMIFEKDGMVMVYVPVGEFTMGSDDGGSNEKPAHQVYLDAFWIDKTEVTYAMYYAKCVNEGNCNESYDSNYPVTNVNWYEAYDYCKGAGRRLPTEAEWEKSARGTEGNSYPWGEGVSCDKANYYGCVGTTTKVGNYPDGASIYGALDMAGNVWEWVNDWYDGNYYLNSPSSNPYGTETGDHKVLRGSSWRNSSRGVGYLNLMRSSFRFHAHLELSDITVGFRCALSQP